MNFAMWVERNYNYSVTQLVYLHGNEYVRNLERIYIEYCEENGRATEID